MSTIESESDIEFTDTEETPNLGSNEEELQSSPIMNSEVNTKVRFALRVKLALLNLQEFYDLLSTHFDAEYMIVSIEKKGTPEQHFHMYMGYSKDIKLKEMRAQLIKFLIEVVGIPKWPSTKGNAVYSLAFSKGNYEKYIVKDGDFLYRGYNEVTIKSFVRSSYRKFQKNEFREQLNAIEEKYMIEGSDNLPGYYSIRKFAQDFIKLKLAYKQVLNDNTLIGYVKMIYYRKNPDRQEVYANSIADRAMEIKML